ncbi:VOC family protein, partial [Streptomyces sp. KAI-27]|uniref:VOC family protein n=2 Tax=unclassified Streptomyces TaxID=2593676 RepID=UPI0034C6DECC
MVATWTTVRVLAFLALLAATARPVVPRLRRRPAAARDHRDVPARPHATTPGGPMTPPPAVRWIYAFADRPRPRQEAVRTFWAAVTGSSLSPSRGECGEFVTFLPPGGADPSFKHQTVTDGPGGTHVDLCVEDVPAFVRHAQEAGAGAVFEEPGLSVLRSPAGLDFCVVPWAGQRTPPPVVADERLDQVCLDIGPAAHERELAFWA